MSRGVQLYRTNDPFSPDLEQPCLVKEVFPLYPSTANPLGLCQLSGVRAKKRVLCFPAMEPGQLQFVVGAAA